MTTQANPEPTRPAVTTALSAPAATIWPCLSFADALAIIDDLTTVFGFEARTVIRDQVDPSRIVHAELCWPEGGGVMLGSADRADSEFSRQGTGHGCVYVVTDRVREVAAVAPKAKGWTIVRELESPDYGGETFALRDPEGNLWSFGSYRGEAAA